MSIPVVKQRNCKCRQYHNSKRSLISSTTASNAQCPLCQTTSTTAYNAQCPPRHKFYVTVTNWLRKHRTSGHVLVFRRKSRTMSTAVSVTERRRRTFWGYVLRMSRTRFTKSVSATFPSRSWYVSWCRIGDLSRSLGETVLQNVADYSVWIRSGV